MISHVLEFEKLAKAPIKQSDVIVAKQLQDPYGYYDGDVIYTSSDYLMSVQIDAVGIFLGTATKKATVKLLGIIDTAKAEDLFQIRLGLYQQDPSVSGFDYISEGFFIVDNVAYDYDAGSTTITMYDHMWTASQTPYSSGIVTYPITVTGLAQGVASALGLDLMASFSTLPNASFTIPSDLYANIANASLQTVIQEIASSTGTIARVSDTTLVFAQYNVLSETLDSSTLKNLTIGNEYGPVTSVVLGRVPQNDNIVLTNSSPTSNFITAINTTTNLLTITGHNMVDGTLVQITSDGTLPAPLVADTNYFIYTNGNANTFALTPTYEDGIAGTHIIDLTTSGTGTITLSQLKVQEVQINNVQILDNDRQDLLPPLYEELLGIGWNASKSNTIGLGWHEVGDVIQYQQGSNVYQSLLSEVHLTLAGSIQENLVSVIPDSQTINYQTAGGILKSIYDTEIKVDKQNNEIESVVSQQLVYQNETLESFTEVDQRIDNVTTQIQSIGGGNLVLNSVGYAHEPDGSLSFWTKSGTGTVTSYSSAASLAAGGTSGNAINLTGSSAQITQRITVANNQPYSVGFLVNKTLGNGSATLTLSNDVTSYTITVASGTAYTWTELKLEDITPQQNYWDVTLAVTSSTTGIEITDLRVMSGPTLVQWDQSHSEILNTQVALTTEGIRVSSSTHGGDYTTMTPIEFAGYSDVSGTSKKVFWVNRDTTEVTNIQVDNTANFGGVIRAIAIPSGPLAGLAFVGVVS